MSWSIELTADKFIESADVDSSLREIPYDRISKQQWGMVPYG